MSSSTTARTAAVADAESSIKPYDLVGIGIGPFNLGLAALSADLGRGSHECLSGGIGKHNRANIAAFYNHAVSLAGKLALQRNQILAYFRNGRYGGHIAGDLVFPNNARDVLAAEENLGGVRVIGYPQGQIGRSRNNRGGVSRIDAFTQHRKRCHSVHSTSVNVLCIQLLGQRTARGRLSSSRWAIHGED